MVPVQGVQWPGEETTVPFDAVTALLQRTARVDAKDKAGTTALMIAAEGGSADAVRLLLLAQGARAGDQDAKGLRAIDDARGGSDPARTAQLVRLLAKSA